MYTMMTYIYWGLQMFVNISLYILHLYMNIHNESKLLYIANPGRISIIATLSITFQSRLSPDPLIQTHLGVRIDDGCFHTIDMEHNLINSSGCKLIRTINTIIIFLKNRFVCAFE